MQQLHNRVLHYQSALAGAQHPANSYVVSTPAGLVLIDPAADLSPQELDEQPAAILVTHVQDEHIAGAANFPDVPLYVPAGDEYLCRGRAAYLATEMTWQEPWDWESRGNYPGHLAGARNERPPLQPLPVAGVLRDGDELFGLRVLATPGHGKNALTYLFKNDDENIAFCGDLICGEGKLWNWFDCDWDYGLQSGQRALLQSAKKLKAENCSWLLPAHGAPIGDPASALSTLAARLEAVLHEEVFDPSPLNFPEKDSPQRKKIGNGWREVLPNLHQWRDGNCAVLLSKTRNALLIDDGLCYWEPEPLRSEHHTRVINELKDSLDIAKIEFCVPTHFHGDHTENIPALIEMEGTEVLCLDTVAEAIEHPERFNLSAALPWYGTLHDTVPIHRRVPDKTKIQWHEYELEIFHLGGQTYYHAGIAADLDGARVLFVGDALSGWNPAPEPILSYNDCEPQTRGWAYAVERMIERAPDVVVCGHGSAIKTPMPLLLEKQARWRRRLAEYSALDARGNSRLFFDPFRSGLPPCNSRQVSDDFATTAAAVAS